MRVLLLGGFGMLGSEVALRMPDAERPTVSEFDVSNPEHVARVAVEKYSLVINCAAYTAVDKAETEPDAAFATNALGPGLLARACSMAGSPLIHISTDYVFDGTKSSPYVESDPTNPICEYGDSKLAGEEGIRAATSAYWILRTSWLFGPFGQCFPRAILKRAREGGPLKVVSDQVGCPTPTALVATTIANLAATIADSSSTAEYGTYHVCGNEVMTWHQFAKRVLAVAGVDVDVQAITTEDWPTPARRPKYSVLDSTKAHRAGIVPEINLDDELLRCLESWD
ncbi:MAG TPA: dTDP-4-dehydrorhamnose reductase [Fimbriimonadaceae bacterium]|nr:dTDP-4-dehydrorhamnose reductase [Fimbriimonadaceae bacterium]